MSSPGSKNLEDILGKKFGINILNSMGLAIAVVDRDFRIVWANSQYHKIQEIPEAPARSVVGRHCYEISFNSKTPCSEKICAVRRTFRTKQNSRGLKVIQKGGGAKFLEVFSFPLHSPQHRLEYGVEVIQDNTRLYKLVQLSDRLTAYASHELKTPLATINQLTNVLRQIDLPSEKRNQLYDRIVSRAQHGLKTVENFLIYSRIKAGELEINPVRTNFCTQVVKQVLDFHTEYVLDKQVKFFCDVPPDLEVVCDPDYIKVIYNNLITNAIKHGGGKTWVFLGYRGQSPDFHYFNVANTGQIIPEQQRERIFKRHVSGQKGGSGIGLDVITELVKKHGGRVWVEPCYILSDRCVWEEEINREKPQVSGGKEANNFIFTIKKGMSPASQKQKLNKEQLSTSFKRALREAI